MRVRSVPRVTSQLTRTSTGRYAWARFSALGVTTWVLLLCQSILAEQSVTLGDYEVHYSAVNSTFLQPEVAERHQIVRADNRATLTISVLHADSTAEPTKISGTLTNLLSQQRNLVFTRIDEGSSRYYLATFLFTNEELLTFDITIHTGGRQQSFQFKQKIFNRST